MLEARGLARRLKVERFAVLALVIGATAAGFMIPVFVHANRMCVFTTTPEDRTKILMTQAVNEAYPQFLAVHPERTCASWEELSEYMNARRSFDAWGTPLFVECADRAIGLRAHSAGPDRLFWTDDDLDSSVAAK